MEFHERLSHRSIIPRIRDFNQMYTQFKIEVNGSKNLTTIFALLKSKIQQLVEKERDFSIHFNELNAEENSPFI